MTAPLILGGVYGAGCETCSAPKDHPCKTSKGEPKRTAHAARVKAAPPIVEAHVGDLVLVRYRGEHVAQLVDIGDPGRAALSVRFWRPSAQTFAAPRLLEREAVIGLAPKGDLRTTLAECAAEESHAQWAARVRADIAAKNERERQEAESADPPPLPADIAEGRGPFDPGQDTSDPSPATADKPADPWFTSDSAPTKAPPKGW